MKYFKLNIAMPKRLITFICLAYLLAVGCRDRYVADYQTPETGYLVVEGYINNSDSPTVIKLSRTTKLLGTADRKPESGATIFVESDDNNRYPLYESLAGTYSTNKATPLNDLKKYRIVISAKGKEYVSDFSSVINTPDIDSISWRRENEGLQLYVHANDPSDKIKFFQWKFDETWEFHAEFESDLEYLYDNSGKITEVWLVPVGQESRRICWQHGKSQNLILGTTEKLNASIVHSPLHFISKGSPKLSIMYSILVKQYGLSKKAYNFLLQMRKNTEGIGSIFDPQPSEKAGNITCTTNPDEMVIGFVEVSQEKTLRIFLTTRNIGEWVSPRTPCITKTIHNHPDSIAKHATGWIPLVPKDFLPNPAPMKIITFTAALPTCVDCTLFGGSLEKPAFWP